MIPELLPNERDYTRALSHSRLTYDLEHLANPMLAAALLVVISFHWLFAGTTIGFVLSAAFILSAPLRLRKTASATRSFLTRVSSGTRIYLATLRLRGLLSVNMAAAAGSAMVIVNTIVITRGLYGFDAQSVSFALAAFGISAAFLILGLISSLSIAVAYKLWPLLRLAIFRTLIPTCHRITRTCEMRGCRSMAFVMPTNS